jgi:hypothetical protein
MKARRFMFEIQISMIVLARHDMSDPQSLLQCFPVVVQGSGVANRARFESNNLLGVKLSGSAPDFNSCFAGMVDP